MIVSGQVWGTAMFAVVNVEEVCDIGQPICVGTFWQAHVIAPVKLFNGITCMAPFHVAP